MSEDVKEERPPHPRGVMVRAFDPWPRGAILTTDPACHDNAPAGAAPVYVDPARYAAMLGAGFLDQAAAAPAAEVAQEVRPDASYRDAAARGEAAGVTITVHADPPPVAFDDPRLADRKEAPRA